MFEKLGSPDAVCFPAPTNTAFLLCSTCKKKRTLPNNWVNSVGSLRTCARVWAYLARVTVREIWGGCVKTPGREWAMGSGHGGRANNAIRQDGSLLRHLIASMTNKNAFREGHPTSPPPCASKRDTAYSVVTRSEPHQAWRPVSPRLWPSLRKRFDQRSTKGGTPGKNEFQSNNVGWTKQTWCPRNLALKWIRETTIKFKAWMFRIHELNVCVWVSDNFLDLIIVSAWIYVWRRRLA